MDRWTDGEMEIWKGGEMGGWRHGEVERCSRPHHTICFTLSCVSPPIHLPPHSREEFFADISSVVGIAASGVGWGRGRYVVGWGQAGVGWGMPVPGAWALCPCPPSPACWTFWVRSPGRCRELASLRAAPSHLGERERERRVGTARGEGGTLGCPWEGRGCCAARRQERSSALCWDRSGTASIPGAGWGC